MSSPTPVIIPGGFRALWSPTHMAWMLTWHLAVIGFAGSRQGAEDHLQDLASRILHRN